jgi:hypothetical protein
VGIKRRDSWDALDFVAEMRKAKRLKKAEDFEDFMDQDEKTNDKEHRGATIKAPHLAALELDNIAESQRQGTVQGTRKRGRARARGKGKHGRGHKKGV